VFHIEQKFIAGSKFHSKLEKRKYVEAFLKSHKAAAAAAAVVVDLSALQLLRLSVHISLELHRC
jgi:hypothetical protein